MCQLYSYCLFWFSLGWLGQTSVGLVMDKRGFRRASSTHQDLCNQQEKDPPTILVQEPWIHTGETSSVQLKCQICSHNPFTVWWTKDGLDLPHDSFRFRQIHNRNQENEFLLKIRNIQSKDFGEYQCNVYANQTKIQKSSAINLTGVPYPAKFDLPTDWTDTTFKLSWRVNCSIYAPIINYQLEFQEIPHGRWVVINIPAKIDFDSLRRHRKHRNKRKKGSGNDVVEFKHTYTIKGLTKGSSYKARIQSRNEYGFSAESVLDLFQTFDIREASTQATTDLFQKIGERQNTYYQDAPTTKKDLHVINSEPLSTNSEKVFSGAANCQVFWLRHIVTILTGWTILTHLLVA